MKTSLQLQLAGITSIFIAAGLVGIHLAAPSTSVSLVIPAKPATQIATPIADSSVIAEAPAFSPATISDPPSTSELRQQLTRGGSLAELEPIAATLAERNTAESVQALLDGISSTRDWPTRAALAKNLRAVSDPDTLQALLPALLVTYGRGNTILNEISDTIGRLAQPDTVDALGALHWQASTQAGQGHKVLRTVACIRNPAAIRGLSRLAARSDSPALAAAAEEALQAMGK